MASGASTQAFVRSRFLAISGTIFEATHGHPSRETLRVGLRCETPTGSAWCTCAPFLQTGKRGPRRRDPPFGSARHSLHGAHQQLPARYSSPSINAHRRYPWFTVNNYSRHDTSLHEIRMKAHAPHLPCGLALDGATREDCPLKLFRPRATNPPSGTQSRGAVSSLHYRDIGTRDYKAEPMMKAWGNCAIQGTGTATSEV